MLKLKTVVWATGTTPVVFTVARVKFVPADCVAVTAVALASVPVVVKLAVAPLPPTVSAPCPVSETLVRVRSLEAMREVVVSVVVAMRAVLSVQLMSEVPLAVTVTAQIPIVRTTGTVGTEATVMVLVALTSATLDTDVLATRGVSAETMFGTRKIAEYRETERVPRISRLLLILLILLKFYHL